MPLVIDANTLRRPVTREKGEGTVKCDVGRFDQENMEEYK